MAPRSFETDDSARVMGKAIRAMRVERKLSQEALGMRAEIHPTYISHIEAGHRNLTWSAVQKISHGLGVTAAQLVQKVEELERAQ